MIKLQKVRKTAVDGVDQNSDSASDSNWDMQGRLEELISGRDFLSAFVNSLLPSHLRRELGVSDIVQSVLFIVFRQQSSFHGDSEARFRAWIFQIARHKILDGIRKFRSRDSVSMCPPTDIQRFYSEVSYDETPSARLSNEEDARVLITALEKLPTEVREIVILHYSEGLPFEEIGMRLKLSQTTCRRRWLEGCEVLRHQLVGLLP